MPSSYQAPRGTRDLLPADAAAFDALEAVIESRALRYGYPRIVTPILEDRGVFVKGVGETSDIVGYEMYDVSLHEQGGLVLRPEGTAAVTRAFLQHGLHRAPRPVRFFYYEPMFRGQRPQLLRYRQFWQWGLECFGPDEPAADVEIIDFTARLFADVGLRSHKLEVNTVGDAKCRPKITQTLASYFSANRDALSEESRKRLETNPLRILDSKDPQDRALVAAAPPLHEQLCAEDRRHFDEVTASLDRLGHEYKVVETLVRGLDYYTRTVMEFVLTDPEFTKGGDIAVAAGGRYNDLVEKLGGSPVPGVGIAGGVDVLVGGLKKDGVRMGYETDADVYVLSAEKGDGADRLQIADPLRQAGFNVAIDYSDRPLDKQLESAVKHGAKVAVIRGTPEARGGNVIVRDLVGKEQRVTRLAAVVTEVGRHVPKHGTPPLYEGPDNPDEHESGAAGEGPFLRDDRD
jgi:histidyl-tRNA synthetase